ncbi:hypothetical protein M2324_004052 [Rhodovulum sulfidophilum]|uniref:hypothetical protein n=1 Tax=Rhodovulum sulfidophilum TaxID=35806 RepID=UPI0005A7518D|nr:hypothetical protein [Rhodovulum sulfidophilum]ANB32630.1 hypothetical protein A6W98_00170 [Rhodovulum sulfidophilum DSM 1374]ANB36480.1 hypothetical protein A6024_00155 [Rhodovulum sulfidophilum]MCW2305620.1 hypothetical protein [Rhodovulum sulfidophilum]
MEADVYNRDILANADDEDILRERYPDIADWLPWPELKAAFLKAEGIAAAEKGKSQRYGRLAIWCALFSTAIIALTPALSILAPVIGIGPETVFGGYLAGVFRYGWIPFLALSAWFGGHSLHGERRARWLEARAQCERLRQLFFQHLACWLPQLVSTDPNDRTAALEARAAALAHLREHYGSDGGAVVHRIVNDLDHRYWALVEVPLRAWTGQTDPRVAACLLRYIRDRRLAYQQRHASRQVDCNALRSRQSIFSRWSAQRRLMVTFGAAFVVFQWIIGVLYIVIDAFPAPPGPQGPQSLTSVVIYAQVAATLSAAFVVALKALEDGMQYRKDMMRYRTYGGITARITAKVDELIARTQADLDRLRIYLLVMEELSYWEMREFLTLHLDSEFST